MSFCFSQDMLGEASDSQQSLTDSLPPTQPFSGSQDSGFRSQRPQAIRTLARPPSCPDFGRGGGVKPAGKRWMFSMSDKKVVGEEVGLQLRQISGQVSSLPRHVSRMLEEAVQFLEKMTQGRVLVSESDWGSVKEAIDQMKQNVTEDNKKWKEISDKIDAIFKLVESVCVSDVGKRSKSDECIAQLLKEVQNQNTALKKVLLELKEIQSRSHDLQTHFNMTSFPPDRSSVLVTDKALHSSLSASPGVRMSAARTDNRFARTDTRLPRTDTRFPRTDNMVHRTDNMVPRTENMASRTDTRFPRTVNMVPRTEPCVLETNSRVSRYLQQPVSTSPPEQLVPTGPKFIYSRPQLAPNHVAYRRLPCHTVQGIKPLRLVPDLQILEMESDSDSE